ncbi:MAG: ComEC/Rec2 family competence protein [Actinomycetota bacterium]
MSANIYAVHSRPIPAANIDKNVIFEGRVCSHPSCQGEQYLCNIGVNKIYLGQKEVKIKKEIVLKTSKALKRDDWVRFSISREGEYYIPIGLHKIYPGNLVAKLFNFRARIYNTLRKAYYNYLNYNSASLSEALVLGNRLNVPHYIMDNFKKAGIFHLLAISGLHLSVFIFLVLRLFREKRNILPPLFFFLAAFNFIVGVKASLLRASAMIIMVLVARRRGREYRAENIFFITFCFLLLVRPGFFYDLGFWLSFTSMGAIFFIYPLAGRLLHKKLQKNYVIRIFLISFSIIAATLPVNAYFFGLVPFTGIFSNILVLPAFYALILILIFSSATIIIWPPAGGMILKLSSPFFSYILKVGSTMGSLDFLNLYFENISVKFMAIYYILLLLLLLLYKYKFKGNGYGKAK